MSMAPFESGNKWPSDNPGVSSQRDADWIALSMILAVTIGIILVCIYAV
jgi:hypothetical protein